MQLDKNLQATMLERVNALSTDELGLLDAGVDEGAASVILHKLLPELDFILNSTLSSLKGKEYDPSKTPIQQEQVAPPVGALGGL